MALLVERVELHRRSSRRVERMLREQPLETEVPRTPAVLLWANPPAAARLVVPAAPEL